MTLFLFVNAATWSYASSILVGVIVRAAEMRLVGYAAYYLSFVILTLVGGFLGNKFQRLQVLYAWTVLGAAASGIPILLRTFSPIHMLLLSMTLGASVGVGMPSCLALLPALTQVQERGRISGVIFFVTCLALFPMLLVIYTNTVAGSVLLIVWRLLGIIPLRYGGWSGFAPAERPVISYSSILRARPFTLYFMTWLTFSLVDTTEQIVLVRFFGSDLFDLIIQTEMIVGAVSALLGGLLLDLVGRKRMAIFSFVVLGLGYAILGLAASMPGSWLAFSIVDGIAWGTLTTLFMLTLWGDLAPRECGEKYYAIGTLAPPLAGIVKALLAPFLELVSISGAFSLASLFLFLSVLPLLMAPETLPEEVLERRRMRRYIERAKKLTKGHVS